MAVTINVGGMEKGGTEGAGLPTSTRTAMDFEEKEAYDLTFRNLTYKVAGVVDKEKVQKTLLDGINGGARHREILAIAGPSGAGKSTLLDALAGRITASSLEGVVLANGKPVDPKQFRKLSGYVMQDDALFPMLTVRETLMFSARLRLPQSMSRSDKAARVDMLINTLGLKNCASTKIGNEQLRGVSGGERRRVSIGVDLVHDPSVLFLDEPTSGLDSTSSLNVMQTLYNLATDRRRTIVLTIHQPSFRILQLIHQLMILSRGSLVYSGSYDNMTSHLEDFGRHVPEHVNVLEYFLDVIEELQETREGIGPLAKFEATKTVVKPLSALSNIGDIAKEVDYATNPIMETLTLLERDCTNIIRTPDLFVANLGLVTVNGLIMGSLFYNVGNDPKGVHSRTSFFIFTIALLLFTSINALPIFLQERNIFIREISRGAYRIASYAISKSVIFLPFFFIQALLLSLITYFMVGLVGNASAFFLFTLTVFMTINVGNSFVTFMSALVPDFMTGNTIITSLTAFMFLFSGFFIPRSDIPAYWVWFNYISTFRYPYELMQKIEYTYNDGAFVDNFRNITTADTIARELGVGNTSLGVNFSILVAMAVACRILFYVGLVFKSSNMRR